MTIASVLFTVSVATALASWSFNALRRSFISAQSEYSKMLERIDDQKDVHGSVRSALSVMSAHAGFLAAMSAQCAILSAIATAAMLVIAFVDYMS